MTVVSHPMLGCIKHPYKVFVCLIVVFATSIIMVSVFVQNAPQPPAVLSLVHPFPVL